MLDCIHNKIYCTKFIEYINNNHKQPKPKLADDFWLPTQMNWIK